LYKYLDNFREQERKEFTLLTGVWVMTSYSDVVGYQHFGGPCCLHLQDERKVCSALDFVEFPNVIFVV
jgi:hypothetical protein